MIIKSGGTPITRFHWGEQFLLNAFAVVASSFQKLKVTISSVQRSVISIGEFSPASLMWLGYFLSIVDDFASAYGFFGAAGACCSMILTTLPG